MSNSLEVFTVKESVLRAALGSKSKRRVTRIAGNCREFFDHLREQLSDDDEEEEEQEEEEFTYEDALHDLIFGEYRPDAPWHIYGYAIEGILNSLGDYQGNVCPINNVERFESYYDNLLHQHGVALSLQDLTMSTQVKGLLPDWDDIPYWGCWSYETCQAAWKGLKPLDVDQFEDADQRFMSDLRQWIAVATRRKSLMIGLLC